ncbi:MAG TPA: tRNA pseudouridine(55) synthase TruB [Blastocatellia bacterium]|nr:tRNA pseudouridine(55) synthase TruB [Blastocatellia bacterium]
MVGALIIDKPAGLTSHDVVARVRRATGTRRVGHAGTLDPFATGVLVCCIGRATRLVQYLAGLDKEYIATVRLGYATDTQDGTGKQITPLRTSDELSLEELRGVVDQFFGPQLQTPPMFSAKKVAGERLYRAARAGREVEREPVSIVVHSIKLLEDHGTALNANMDGTRDFRVQVRCSSGTYVRTLAHDLGAGVGVGAHLVGLRRTEVGHFRLAEAVTLEELERMSPGDLSNALIGTSDMLSHLAVVKLDDDRVKLVVNGRGISLSDEETAVASGGSARLCDRGGRLVAVGEYDAMLKLLKPRVVMGAEGDGLG